MNILALDLDGVVVNFNAMWIAAWEQEFGEVHHFEDIVDYDYRKRNVDMTSSSFWRWCRNVRLWDPAKTVVYPENYETALRLHKRWDIHIVTSKPRWAQADTAAWLESSGIKYESLTFTREKWRVVAHAYVDDSPKNLASLVDKGHGTVYRQVRGWNRPVDGTYDIESLEALL